MRGWLNSSRWRGRWALQLAIGLVLTVCVSLLAAVPASAYPNRDGRRPTPQKTRSVKTNKVRVKPQHRPGKGRSVLPRSTWPKAGTGEVDLTKAASGQAAGQAAKTGALKKAGTLPVWIGPADHRADRQGRRVAPGTPGRVKVQVLDPSAATKAGVQGMIFKVGAAGNPQNQVDGGTSASPGVTPQQRTAAPPAPAQQVSLQIDYSGFRYASGGNWAQRLRLVRLPDCGLTTPALPQCQPQPVARSHNDPTAGRVTAQIDLPAGTATDQSTSSAKAVSSTAVYALAAAASGPAGDFSATSLSPSATWQVSAQSGDFSWSYPVRMPPAASGPTPQIGLSYSSGGVDGRTASTNNQTSWIGEGFDYWPGYIERKYKSCSDDGQTGSPPPGDQCWGDDNATMSLNGSGAELVKDDATGVWRPKNDDGSKIELLTGATNGDDNGEHWRVTTADGTQYYFGLARLPKWATGNTETKSTWTAPVFGDDAGEPCHGASFAASSCNQAWRWNLDYVVDPRGNAMSLWYGTETNYYAKNKVASPGTAYIRGGYLSRIDYGQRSDTIFSAKAPYQVVFDVKERCIPDANFDCAEAKFTSANKSRWPDVPFDQNCASGATCTNKLAPTFWTRKRLAGVKTQFLSGTTYSPVDSWIFDQSIPAAGDVSDPSLRLDGLTHTGEVGGSAALPKISFGYTAMDNRVDAIGDGLPAFLKWRVSRVDNEHGGTTTVGYSGKECTGTALPAPATNTKRCFPQRIVRPGATDPNDLITDWLHKYRVDQVSQDDRVGGTPAEVTNYQYLDQPAWHYADDQALVQAKYKTWSQWRGYSKVRVLHGATNETRSRTDYLFFRGMHGDRANADGSQTKTVTITDSEGTESTDHRYLQGSMREQITYNGVNGAEVSGQITTPWAHGPTAKQGGLEAWMTDTSKVRNRVALAAGGDRVTEVVKTFNDDGTVKQEWDKGVIGDAGKDDLCTNTTYMSNAAKGITGLVDRNWTVSRPCDQTPTIPDDAVSDVQTSYDMNYGETTEVKEARSYSGSTPQYVSTSKTVYDGYGRTTQTFDAAGNKTTTAYIPATGGPITGRTITNALGHAVTQTLSAAWGLPTQTKDANQNVTTMAYDPLGRLLKVWGPTRTTSQTPNAEFAYLVSGTAPTAITTKQLLPNGQRRTTYQIFDGWLRPRQGQAPGTTGGRVLTDVYYDTRGQAYKTNQPYFDKDGVPGTTLLAPAQDNAVPNQTLNTIDGVGRVTNSAYYSFATKKWETTTSYGGDRVTVTPPKGGTPTTTITNARGKTTELWQYKSATASGDHDTTSYTYTPAGELATVTDPAGNQWKYGYDIQGNKTKVDDPDRGSTTFEYNTTGGVTKTTDAEGRTLAFTYDALGRKTAQYKDSTTGPKLAEWTYDTVAGAKGAAAASTRWVNGQAYKHEVTSYDKAYRPLTSQVTIPATEGNLGKTYPTTTAYNGDGSVSSMSMPQAGALPEETVRYIYDSLGHLGAVGGTDAYVQGTTYTEFGEVSQLKLGTSTSKWVWQTNYYEEGTRRLARARTDRETIGVGDNDVNYTYDATGNVTKIANTPAQESADVQCFGHDYLRRLTQAWTAASTGDTCETAPTPQTAATAIGGPQPYWQSFTYDVTGNRTKDIQHDVTGDTTKDRTGNYTYNGNGKGQPHTLTKLETTSPTGTAVNTYDYDKTGNTTLRQVGGDDQKLEWDAEGRLSKVTKTTEQGTQSSSYLYDANGNLLIRKDSDNTKTLFLDGQELKVNGSGTVTGTRYYSHGDQVVAVRTENGTGQNLTWLISDHQGTSQVAIDSKTQALTRRRYMPFGQLRTAPANWPGTKSFVGGTPDPATGMVHLGAREYDADTGRFASADPIIDHGDPQQMNGYAYANNSPASNSDPDGLMCRSISGYLECSNGDGVDRRPNSGGNGYTVWRGGKPVARSGDTVSDAQYRRQLLEQKAAAARAKVARAQAQLANAAKIIAKIAADELGITAGLDCLTTGDLGACGETVLNLAMSAVGGFAGKILAKYANPFKWGKAANLAKRLWGAIKTIGGGIADWFKARRELKVAESAIENIGETCPINSFTRGTRVQTGKTKYRSIEKIKPGDWVLSTDPKTGKVTRKRVTGVITGQGKKRLVRITIAPDRANGTAASAVIATDGHPFWATISTRTPWRTKSLSGWVNAGDLKPEMMLRTSAGRYVQITAVRAWTQQQHVYNLTVAGTHTYYVEAGDTPILVHNCGTDPGAVHLDLKYKDGWTSDQIAEADGKVAYLNDLAQDGLLVKTPSVRVVSGSAAGRLRRAGEPVPRGYHGDHMQDLQLGGADTIDNLGALDGSVNTSLGPQIDARIRNLPNGTSICGVSICAR